MSQRCKIGNELWTSYWKFSNSTYDSDDAIDEYYYKYKNHLKNCEICQNSDDEQYIKSYTVTWDDIGNAMERENKKRDEERLKKQLEIFASPYQRK